MKRKKIVHVITGNEGGGAEKMLEKLSLFSKSTFEHHVIVLKFGNKLNVQNLHQFDFTKNPLNFIFEFLKLLIFFKKLKPDVIMSWLYHSDLLTLILTKILRFPKDRLIWNVRCSYLDLDDYNFTTKVVLKFLSKFSKNVGRIIFNSFEGMRYHKMIGYKNKYMEVIPNGFDLNSMKLNNFKKKILKKKIKIQSKKIVAMIARNDPTKHFDIFLNLPAKIFIKKSLNIKFLIAGKDTKKLNIPLKKSNSFINIGYKKNIIEYLNIVDILVLISKGEGFPNIIGEAMCMNIPVVCNDVGDNKKIVENSGIIVNKKPSVNKIRRAIIKILKNKKKYSGGRKIIKKNIKLIKL